MNSNPHTAQCGVYIIQKQGIALNKRSLLSSDLRAIIMTFLSFRPPNFSRINSAIVNTVDLFFRYVATNFTQYSTVA